jgi:primosomal protein N''
MINLLKVFPLFLLLTACLSESEVLTKQYYLDNEQERIAQLAFCAERTDKNLTDQNCINATEAKAEIKRESFKTEGITVDYSSASAGMNIEKSDYEKKLAKIGAEIRAKAEAKKAAAAAAQ